MGKSRRIRLIGDLFRYWYNKTGPMLPLLWSGHYLAECPRLPAVLQREATTNREAYQRGQRAREATRHENPDTGIFIRQGNKTEVIDMESAVQATETPIESILQG
jgi:hypothetical protein